MNVNAERMVLGQILVNGDGVLPDLEPEHFSLEKHRRIFTAMQRLRDSNEAVDRIGVVEELMRCGQLDSVDGFSYVASLDEGLPAIPDISGYVRIVRGE